MIYNIQYVEYVDAYGYYVRLIDESGTRYNKFPRYEVHLFHSGVSGSGHIKQDIFEIISMLLYDYRVDSTLRSVS